MEQPLRFQDKIVFISGSSSGIGKAAALSFVKQGAKVILSSRNIKSNESLVNNIKSMGGDALLYPLIFQRVPILSMPFKLESSTLEVWILQ